MGGLGGGGGDECACGRTQVDFILFCIFHKSFFHMAYLSSYQLEMMLLVAAFVVVANVGDSRIGRRGSQPGSDVAALQLQPTRTLHKSKQEMRTTGIILVRYLIT